MTNDPNKLFRCNGDGTFTALTDKEIAETTKTPAVSSANYVDLAMRTDAVLTAELLHRLTNPQVVHLLHAAMGMVTEAGELMDMLKKHVFANKPLDLVNAGEELGDSMWYIAKGVDSIRALMSEVMQQNIDKLRIRFPDKFSEHHSLNRDVTVERTFLEGSIKKCVVIENDTEMSKLSLRGRDWLKFSDAVLEHIENYTVPQYGDKGNDRASDYTTEVIADHIGRYKDRMGSNARGEVEAKRDLVKIAHYASLAHQL